MTTIYSPRVSKLTIIPVERQALLCAIVRFEKSGGRASMRCVLSLKDQCARILVQLLGDEDDPYRTHLPPQLIHYVTYDILAGPEKNESSSSANVNDNTSDVESKFCRDCSLSDLGASTCRRRKCLANRMRQVFEQLSRRIIAWEDRQYFGVLENNDDDEDDPLVFIYLKSYNSRCLSSKEKRERRDRERNRRWMREKFYLLDLLRILDLDLAQE